MTAIRARVATWLLLTVAVVSSTGCASWALSTGGPLDRAADHTTSQIQTMRLVTTAGCRSPAPRPMLETVLTDSRSVLRETAGDVEREPLSNPRRDPLLTLIDRARRLLDEEFAAVRAGDCAQLRRIESDLTALVDRIEHWEGE